MSDIRHLNLRGSVYITNYNIFIFGKFSNFNKLSFPYLRIFIDVYRLKFLF